MNYLKQSTVTTVMLGPFLDDTDGKTAETGLTILQADVRVSKNGGNMAQKNQSWTCVHDELGYYTTTIDATDTNTLGHLKIMVHESGALPVWNEYLVVTANVYDSLCSTDVLQSDLTQIGGVVQSATDLKDLADTGYNPATHKVAGVVLTDGCTANSDMVGTDNAALAATAVTASDVNAEMVDVMTADQTTEMGVGAPPVAPTMEQMIAYLYFRMRNKTTTTSTLDTMYADNGSTAIMKASISDNGTTFTKDEYISGA